MNTIKCIGVSLFFVVVGIFTLSQGLTIVGGIRNYFNDNWYLSPWSWVGIASFVISIAFLLFPLKTDETTKEN